MFFTDHFRPEPSAPAAHVYERCRIWVEQGHEVTVICSAPNFPEGKVYDGYSNRLRAVENMDGVRVVRVFTFIFENKGILLRTLDYASYVVSSFINAIFEDRPNVVISTSPHLLVPLSGLSFAHFRRVPHVVEVRDLWPAAIESMEVLKRGKIYDLLEKLELWYYGSSTRILTLSPAFNVDLKSRGVPSEKIDLAINGTDLRLFSPMGIDEEVLEKYGLGGRFVVGHLGTIGLAQGLENVIETAEILRGTDVSFFFVGVGAAKEALEEEVSARGLGNVVFAPRQLHEEMPGFWSVCDLSLIHQRNHPNFATILPSKIFESMAMRLPIVYVCPEGAGSALIKEHAAGVVVPPANPPALAKAILELRDDPVYREMLSQNSLKAAPNFSREKQAKNTLTCLQKAVQQWR